MNRRLFQFGCQSREKMESPSLKIAFDRLSRRVCSGFQVRVGSYNARQCSSRLRFRALSTSKVTIIVFTRGVCTYIRVHACSRAQDVGRRYHSCRSPCRRRRDASTLLSLKGSEQTPARRDEEDRDCREKRERAGAGARRSERGEGNERYSRVKIKGK